MVLPRPNQKGDNRMGMLGGLLLVIAVVMFLLGLAPVALFIGAIGALFTIIAADKGKEGDAAKGFGCGCFVIVVIIAILFIFLYKMFTSEDEGSYGFNSRPIAQHVWA